MKRASLIVGIAVLFSLPSIGKLRTSYFRVRTLDGAVQFPAGSEWSWKDSCRSISRPCIRGKRKGAHREKHAYFFATRLPKTTDEAFFKICKNTKKNAVTKKSKNGVPFCHWLKNGGRQVFFKAGRSFFSGTIEATSSEVNHMFLRTRFTK